MYQYVSQRMQVIRSYYGGIGKTTVLGIASFSVALAMNHVILGLVFYVRDVFSASPSIVGWLNGTWSFAYVIGCLLLRPLLARVLPRYLIIGSTLGLSLLTLAMWRAPTMGWVFLFYGLFGIVLSFFYPPLMGWLSTDVEGEALSRTISRFNLSWCMGSIIGPFSCGWLSETSVHLPLVAAGIICFLTAVFVAGAALSLPRMRMPSPPPGAGRDEAEPKRSTPLRYPAWLGLFVCFCGVGVVAVVLPLAGREQLGLRESTIGAVFMGRSLANAAMFLWLGATTFWHFRTSPMLSSIFLSALAFIVLACMHSAAGVAILFIALGALTGFSYSQSIFHGVSGSTDRATRMAIHESVLATGVLIGSAAGGILYQIRGPAFAYRVAAVWLTAGLAGMLILIAVLRHNGAMRNAG